MLCLEVLHGLNHGVDTLDSLSVVATCTETTYASVTLDADHTTLCSEIEEVLLQLFVLVVHHEADVHQRTILLRYCSTEQLVAVDLSVRMSARS